MAENDGSQRSGGVQVNYPGGSGAASAPGANTSQKGGGLSVPQMPPPPTGNTAPKSSGSYKGIPDGE